MTVERSAMSKASNLKRTVIPVLAELECDGVGNFEVKSERFSVGRGQNSNMPIASSNLVSRKHIEVGPFSDKCAFSREAVEETLQIFVEEQRFSLLKFLLCLFALQKQQILKQKQLSFIPTDMKSILDF